MKNTNKLFTVLTLLALLLASVPLQTAQAAGNVYYVVPGGMTSGSCDSWLNACTLQTALTNAVSGEEIWVAAGIHTPGVTRTATFQLRDGVAIYGGFDGAETARDQRDVTANLTILSGDIGVPGDTADNVYRVVNGANGATLDGFTISGGNADNGVGGGMYNSVFANTTLTNVIFSGNTAGMGGGAYLLGSPTLTNVIFSDNTADLGGGVYNNGSPTLTNVTFSGNTASQGGGGMLNSSSSPTLINVTFIDNASAKNGGGMYNTGSSPTLTNVTFSNNTAHTYGGGICNAYSSSLSIRNSIFWGNTGVSVSAQLINFNGSGIAISDSVVQDGYAGGTNIITDDPRLGVTGNYGGFSQTIPLLPGSSAIGAASTNCPATDQRGEPRSTPNCDLGAFESQGFSLSISGGNNQGALPGTAFANPLQVNVTALNILEPVNGGQVTFTAPISGASAALATSPVTISGAAVSVNATANETEGSYQVAASAAGADSVYFNLENDGTAPTITSFLVNSSSNSLDIPINAFTASDNIGVTGYLITTSSTAPAPGAAGWSGAAPATYTVASVGSYTLYPWAKDATGNVSAVFGSPASVSIDMTSPTVGSIVRVGEALTNASSVDFTVTFSEAVTAIDVNDFATIETDTLTGTSVTEVSGSGTTYTITVDTGSGAGTLWLEMPDTATITDPAGNPLANLPFTSSNSYVVRQQTFSDVPATHWAWRWIEQLYEIGITGGCGTSPLIYCPDNTVTRAEMAIFLLRGMHRSSYTPPAVGEDTGFEDVPVTHWAAAWIKQLAAEGITGGCGLGIYCPENRVTRAEMAIFLLRAEHGSSYAPPDVGDDTGFGDVPITHWAAAWIKQLAAEGITGGCGTGNYCPDNRVTRAEMAVFLMRVPFPR